MIDIDIQISISERSSGWATNYYINRLTHLILYLEVISSSLWSCLHTQWILLLHARVPGVIFEEIQFGIRGIIYCTQSRGISEREIFFCLKNSGKPQKSASALDQSHVDRSRALSVDILRAMLFFMLFDAFSFSFVLVPTFVLGADLGPAGLVGLGRNICILYLYLYLYLYLDLDLDLQPACIKKPHRIYDMILTSYSTLYRVGHDRVFGRCQQLTYISLPPEGSTKIFLLFHIFIFHYISPCKKC